MDTNLEEEDDYDFPVLRAQPGDAWRRCFKCGGIEIIAGNPQLKEGTPIITFRKIAAIRRGRTVTNGNGATVVCSNCGNVQWAK